jgi:hypothetical protein
LCKYNFTICSLNLCLEVQGQWIGNVAAFNLFWFGSYQCHKVPDKRVRGMGTWIENFKFPVREGPSLQDD